MNNERWLTVPEAATELRVSTKTIRRWIGSGHLTARRVGPKLLRIDSRTIERMLA
ncbi:helix-turn-helix domain-containing protein [Williamsia herbipolensis]|uniref:Helix-turn-helix domain-containing protein n=1 Tax=Williamsia herbipolensis TaxID=1603258 RepID=A0AAU4K4K1_9NOCA|nr:helix-turn-helix domain-containing protein [Williamsia herbipolensis]